MFAIGCSGQVPLLLMFMLSLIIMLSLMLSSCLGFRVLMLSFLVLHCNDRIIDYGDGNMNVENR